MAMDVSRYPDKFHSSKMNSILLLSQLHLLKYWRKQKDGGWEGSPLLVDNLLGARSWSPVIKLLKLPVSLDQLILRA